MRVVLVGAGRLATNLGVALKEAGHEVMGVYSRTMVSALQLAEQVGGEATDRCDSLPKDADIYIIAVKDAVLEQLITQVVKGREDRLFVHTAGSLPLSLFEGCATRYGVFYPMQTFSKERCVDFAEIPVFVEASDAASLMVMKTLAESISRRVYELSTAERKFLHLAAVFACNFANHCYALSADVLAKHGLPFDVMLPLIDETARKVHELSPAAAQTGPAVRYDENVIRMQRDLLADEPAVQELYDRLSLSIHKKATKQ